MAPITYNFRLDTQLSKRKTVERVNSAKVPGKKPKKETDFPVLPVYSITKCVRWPPWGSSRPGGGVVCFCTPKTREKVPGPSHSPNVPTMSCQHLRKKKIPKKQARKMSKKKTTYFFLAQVMLIHMYNHLKNKTRLQEATKWFPRELLGHNVETRWLKQ